MEVKYFVRIDEFHFASIAPKFIAFGLSPSLLEIFKVIKHTKLHWTWPKPRDTLGIVSDGVTTLKCTWKSMINC